MNEHANDLGDEHYRRIAELRNHFGHRYAQEIAELYGKPIRTVHRWVREARLRGLLEPWSRRPCPTCKRPYNDEQPKDAR